MNRDVSMITRVGIIISVNSNNKMKIVMWWYLDDLSRILVIERMLDVY